MDYRTAFYDISHYLSIQQVISNNSKLRPEVIELIQYILLFKVLIMTLVHEVTMIVACFL